MKKVLLVVLLAFGLAAQARMVDETRTVSGVGATWQEALNAALYMAVQQVRGAELGTEKNLQSVLNVVVGERTDVITLEQKVTHDIYADTHGWIKSYEVLSATEPKTKDGHWTVRASVVVPHFESDVMPDDKRLTVAVAPFVAKSASYTIEGEVLSGREVGQRLSEEVQTSLTQNGRFAVVNRGQADAMMREFALLASPLVSAQEASRLGQVAGADVMVVGTVRQLGKPTRDRTFYGADFNANRIQVEVSYQLVEVASQRVVWADRVRLTTLPDRNFETWQLFDQVAQKIAAGATATLYPVKVLDVVSAQQVYLTQGGLSVQVGDQLAVLDAGKPVQDPDTGETLVVNGPPVAVVEVTSVEAKYSVAKMLSGEVAQLSANAVLKPLAAVKEAPGAPHAETPGSSSQPLKWK